MTHHDINLYDLYGNKICNFYGIVLKKFKFYFYVLKIKSYLIGVKKWWYKDDCIYLKKLYGKCLRIFVTIFLKTNITYS